MKKVIAITLVVAMLMSMCSAFALGTGKAVPSQEFSKQGKTPEYWVESDDNMESFIMYFMSELLDTPILTYDMIDTIKFAIDHDYAYIRYTKERCLYLILIGNRMELSLIYMPKDEVIVVDHSYHEYRNENDIERVMDSIRADGDQVYRVYDSYSLSGFYGYLSMVLGL